MLCEYLGVNEGCGVVQRNKVERQLPPIAHC